MKELNSCKEAMAESMEKKYFSVAHLYKDEKAMDMHIHDCYELYYSISGGKQFLIDNKLYDVAPGDIFLISQYDSHYLTQIDKELHERIVIMIDPDFTGFFSTTSLATASLMSFMRPPRRLRNSATTATEARLQVLLS